MHYSKIKQLDISNGKGIRVSIFVSGCGHHCKGCFNKETWDFTNGKPYTQDTQNEIINSLKYEMVRGLSILGGEPLDEKNQECVCNLIRTIRSTLPEKDIWLWTGYTFGTDIPQTEFTKEILSNIDVLIDGEFKEELKVPNLKYRGSSNQRVLVLNPKYKL